jgi:hypothetical protein
MRGDMIEVFKIINGMYDPLTTVIIDARLYVTSGIASYVYVCRQVIFALLVLPVLI